MIKNERQYLITKTQLQKFKTALDQLQAREDNIDPILLKVQKDALEGQIEEFQKEIEEYERLQTGEMPNLIELKSFESLPNDLIKSRIARKMSQKDLADLIGVKEQQVQRWEATDYSTISLGRLKTIIKALNLVIPEDLLPPSQSFSFLKFFKKMENIGLDRELLVKRLLPPILASVYEEF